MAMQSFPFTNFRNKTLHPSKTIYSTKLGVSSSPLLITKIRLSPSSLTSKSAIKAQQMSHEEDRPQVGYPPTIWGDSFRSFSFNQREYELYTEQIEVLKSKVKKKLISSADDALTKLNFINLLIRLGLSYHFEDHIEQQLNANFDALVAKVSYEECDLHTVSLVFRVLRQNGYRVTSDAFNKFKDSNGKFKQSLATDVKGVLSLYEAAFVSITGEDILDEAIAFTKPILESYSSIANVNGFQKHISNALKHPLHRGMPRVEARHFISLYETDESRDESLLTFAKLDFNRVQLLHQQELSHLSIWWSDLNLASKYPFARDRIVEVYFWSIGVFFEPQYAASRLLVSQTLILLTVVDDIYEAYGALHELRRFTEGIERWGTVGLDLLPEYMKTLYKAVINLVEEAENDMKKDGRAITDSYVKNEMIQITKGYMTEIQWFHKGYTPSPDEYMETAFYTGGIPLAIAACYAGMVQIKDKEFKWLTKCPKIIKAAGTLSRLLDDLGTHKDEQERASGHSPSVIECYMNHAGVSEEKATQEIQRLIEASWKEMNEECLRPTTLPMSFLMPIVNIIRVAEVCYRHYDSLTKPEYVKDHIEAMFIQPIQIQP